MKTELEQIERMSPLKLFKPKFMPTLLKAIEIEVTSNVPDVETPDGRKAITSLAYKVARSKTTIDDLGKAFVAEQKAAIAGIDSVRKSARDFLDNLKAQVRQPLTDWEDAEAKRVEKIQIQLMHIRALSALTNESPGREGERFSSEVLAKSLKLLRDLKITKRFAEYQDEAVSLKNAGIIAIMDEIPLAEGREQEVENARLYAEQQAEDQRVENEQRIAREAVEAADSKAQRELDQIKEDEAQEKREQELRDKNTRHKGHINREAAEALVKINPSLDDVLAKQIVKSIVKGQIPNVTIKY